MAIVCLTVLLPAPVQAKGKWKRALVRKWTPTAMCESGGRWHIRNPPYSGGLQFLDSTWTSNGGGRYAKYAYQATRWQQSHIANLLDRRTGSSSDPWPNCPGG